MVCQITNNKKYKIQNSRYKLQITNYKIIKEYKNKRIKINKRLCINVFISGTDAYLHLPRQADKTEPIM